MGARRGSESAGRRGAFALMAGGLTVLIAALLFAAMLPAPASAATDDDIPGVPAPASPIAGSLADPADHNDVYSIAVPAGKILHVSLSASAGTDFDMSLYSPDSASIATGDRVARATGTTYPDSFTYVPSETGTYYLNVYIYDGSGDYTVTYSLEDAGHVTGTVTNAGGVGLAGIGVTVYQWSDVYDEWDYVSDATTTGDGSYDLGGLASGSYRLRFEDWAAGVYLAEYYNDKADLDAADDVSVTAGSTTTGIDAVLAAGGHITGSVTNAGHAGLAGIQVTVYQWSDDFEYWRYVGDAYTTDDGGYDVGGLASGSYRLRFTDESGTYAPECYNDKADLERCR